MRKKSRCGVTNPMTQACPLCKGIEVDVYIDAKGGTLSADALGSSRTTVAHGKVLRCRNCHFVFSEFRPQEAELHTLYREMNPSMYEKEAPGRLKTAQRHLEKLHKFVKGGKLIDVGCASGAFLRSAAEAGWNVTGVEPSKVLADLARETLGGRGEIHCATLQEAHVPPSYFDALTLWDVLEHVTDPLAFLTSCAELLKPGGYLFANLPDIGSLQAQLMGDRWPLLLAEHLNYFDQNTLKLCAEQAGLHWVAFTRRPATFTLGYVLYRLSQHRIPASGFAHRMGSL